MEVISTKRHWIDDVEAEIIGKWYKYLIREFAESRGQIVGEFYTPTKVGTQRPFKLFGDHL
ncbi:MAG: N-6 DNA methylase [Planctomycetaceae bacterium]|nr:N-6 DNA methylase [Planctomycetaceae bacterium]